MGYRAKGTYAPAGKETWKCSQCGTEFMGTRIARRSALKAANIPSTAKDYIQSKCPSCGNVMCGQCLELQKASEYTPDSEVLCPECGTKFGDGPVLVPEQLARQYDTEDIGVEATGYVKDLKGWAGWLVFWGILNFFGTASVLSQAASPEYELVVPEIWLHLSLLADGIIFVSALICLASPVPWAGFYAVFSLYLIMVGLFNLLTADGFWRIIGIVQIVIGIAVIGKGAQYSSSRTDSGGY